MTTERVSSILNGMPRISWNECDRISNSLEKPHLLIDSAVQIAYLSNNCVRTVGLGQALDSKTKELVSLVSVDDALAGVFKELNVLVPRTFADQTQMPYPHVVAQAIILHKWTDATTQIVAELSSRYSYGRQGYDTLWASGSAVESVPAGTTCLVMNRRIGGWDGSPARPVMELLGGGGHVKTVWCPESNAFVMQSVHETLLQELQEELGFAVTEDLHMVGGFHNTATNELVVLGVVWVSDQSLLDMQKSAIGNSAEDTDGIYIGLFEEVLRSYSNDASPFAGGERAKATNFPSNLPLMSKLAEFIDSY